ncbi:MAG: bifunctional UDP-N-acetylglucosamine diphosphorylase/glucosamine-1-phosphate N-acetyltransferase GlmU [Wenzhouxiangellaceae bacterium]|nr:bifunctional UDP-N-acetylglucosamine diphosphorylase/glucosamine-1-phosphate N-acetyltransferase GlmU [Wenzhouxiangellaceae bacterium]
MTARPLHVVILAAGEGKRMNSRLPKVLQPVGGQPMLRHVVDTALALDPESVHVVVGYGAEQVRELLAEIADARVVTADQREQLGTGHAVQQAIGAVPARARVLVLYGDMPLVRRSTLERFLALDQPAALMSFIAPDPHGYGRILRDVQRNVVGIREQRDASGTEERIDEVNSGVLAADADRLAAWLDRIDDDNAQREYYLTDCIGLAAADGIAIGALVCDDPDEALGANDMRQLAALESGLQHRRRDALMAAGVRMAAPETVHVRAEVAAGRDTVIEPGCVLEGRVELGDGVVIGPGSVVRDCRLAAGTRIEPSCVLDGVETTGPCTIGPFARLRPGTVLAAGVKVGNFVETKNARFDQGAKASHLSYVGDAEVGARANLGAGTITCNYDGAAKHRTVIGDDAFIGSNTALVAPVRIGAGATIGAGSVICSDAPDGELTLARARQTTVPDWERPVKKADG